MDRREFLGVAAAAGLAGCAAPETRRGEGFDRLSPNGGNPNGGSPNGVGSTPLAKIGLASCADETKPQPLWDTVLADRPDLFIFGGDNVYYSESPFDPRKLVAAYETEAKVASFARLRDTVPHMAVWDDNDYGSNDGGADFPFKQAAKDAFLDFWRAPAGDVRRTRGGIFDAQVFGPPGRRVQVIVTDTRWYRSPLKRTDQRNAPGKERYLPDADPAKSMLGAEQWRWLESQLRVPAEVRLIVSGTQVLAEGHGWERWGNFPLERERLYKLVASTGANGVVFLSGDRHFGAIYRETNGTPYPFYELTSSGVTHPWADAREAGPNRVGELFTQVHYGTVEIDWGARSLALHLKGLDGGPGRPGRTQPVAFNELRIPATVS